MKKTIICVFMVIISLSTTSAFAKKADNKLVSESATLNATENKLSEEELNTLKMRVEAIRDMDKSDLTVEERRELRSELKEIRENVKKAPNTIYIGTGTLILIIILIILLV